MKLIVGLGNPDDKYKNTFHNLGFMCVDSLAEKLNVTFNKTKCRALTAEINVNGEKVILAKPQTYMNLSGESVRELVTFYKIEMDDLIVCYDDFDVHKGFLRIRENGSAGTHNGMRNIIKELNRSDFPRIRVGFLPEGENKIPLINYVLSGLSKDDKIIFDKVIDKASSALVDFIDGVKIQDIMQKYNGKVSSL